MDNLFGLDCIAFYFRYLNIKTLKFRAPRAYSEIKVFFQAQETSYGQLRTLRGHKYRCSIGVNGLREEGQNYPKREIDSEWPRNCT